MTTTTISSTNITKKIDCVSENAHVNSLRGTTTKNVPGWNLINVEGGSVVNASYWRCHDGNSWYGFRYDGGICSIDTTLRRCGVAKLDFGECSKYGGPSAFILVNLNGKEIGRATRGQLSKTIEFNFKDGDILELKESRINSYIRFNSFTVISCC